MLLKKAERTKKSSDGAGGGNSAQQKAGGGADGGKRSSGRGGVRGGVRDEGFDDHGHWGDFMKEESSLRDAWQARVRDAYEVISKSHGDVPLGAERAVRELSKPQTDWRTVLSDFVQEEICDYSFSPPDRRYDGDLFLPDFNDKDVSVEDVLFMVDTSGSVSDGMLTAAFSEVKGAIEQFNGKLRGMLGFFDSEVYEPVPFDDVESLLDIRPRGGGGTSFEAVFRYVEEKMSDKPPVSIVVLTDGICSFPEESAALGIPVLWLLNNDRITPPWGRITRISVEDM